MGSVLKCHQKRAKERILFLVGKSAPIAHSKMFVTWRHPRTYSAILRKKSKTRGEGCPLSSFSPLHSTPIPGYVAHNPALYSLSLFCEKSCEMNAHFHISSDSQSTNVITVARAFLFKKKETFSLEKVHKK